MSKIIKIICFLAFVTAPTLATAAAVNVVSWGGAYTESQKLRIWRPICREIRSCCQLD